MRRMRRWWWREVARGSGAGGGPEPAQEDVAPGVGAARLGLEALRRHKLGRVRPRHHREVAVRGALATANPTRRRTDASPLGSAEQHTLCTRIWTRIWTRIPPGPEARGVTWGQGAEALACAAWRCQGAGNGTAGRDRGRHVAGCRTRIPPAIPVRAPVRCTASCSVPQSSAFARSGRRTGQPRAWTRIRARIWTRIRPHPARGEPRAVLLQAGDPKLSTANKVALFA